MRDVTFYFDVGSPYAYLAAERARNADPGAGHVAAGPARGTVQADRPQLLGARRPRAATGRHGRDRATRAKLRAAADPLARPLADRLPRRDAGGDVRVHRRRGRGRGGEGRGPSSRHEAFRAAFQRRARAEHLAHVLAVATRAGLRRRRASQRASPIRRSRRRSGRATDAALSAACSACRLSPWAMSCSGATTGSRTPPRTSAPRARDVTQR